MSVLHLLLAEALLRAPAAAEAAALRRCVAALARVCAARGRVLAQSAANDAAVRRRRQRAGRRAA
jgi:hypothetical protein